MNDGFICTSSFSVELAGDAIVPVADCSKEHFDSHCKKEMKMADYLDYWRRHMVQRGNETGEVKKDEGLLYLKDWHFVK